MNQRITRLVLASALIACTSLAQAQWMWVNEKGVKQFSDQPPPPGTPANRILKAPRGQSVPDLRKELAAAPAEGEEAAPVEAKEAPAAPTVAERNAAYKKRQKEAAEKTAKADEEAKRAAEKKKFCAEARSNIGLLESGARVAEADSSGERSFMSDEARAQKVREQREAIDKNCR